MEYRDMDSAQFENVNALRSYPFADGSSLADRNGRELGKDVVVDLRMFVPSTFSNPHDGFSRDDLPVVRMTSAHLSRSMVSVCFVSGTGQSATALSATVSRERFSPYTPYRLEKLHGSVDVGGAVTFGDFDFPEFPETYFLDGATVNPCCIVAARPAGVRRFIDPRSGESVSGDAMIRFSGHVISKREGNSFGLSLEDGSEVELASECSGATLSSVCGATPIKSINGVRPDGEGNIVLWFH